MPPTRLLKGGNSLDYQLMFLGDVNAFNTIVDGQTLVWNEATERFIPSFANSFINVKDYGALGDGVTDDTAAIKLALLNGVGKTVYFPAGTYRVVPTSANILPLFGACRIMGEGKQLTTIKLSNSAGVFYSLFFDASHNLSGLTFSDFTLDMNIDRNPIADLAEIMAHPRVAFYIGSGATGSKIRFENVEVKNNNSVNTIVVTDALSDVTVRGCSFINKQDSNLVTHDHSTLYLISTYNIVTDNYFEGDACPQIASACAVETHGSHTVISNNRIRRFAVACNLTGVSHVEDTTDTTVVGNVADEMDTGFALLWSYSYLTHTTGYGMDGVVISNNTVHIKQTTTAAGSSSVGIGIYPTNTLPVRNIQISNNVLIWEKELSDRDANSASFGIGYWSSNDMAVENLIISDNLVENMPMAGIRLSCPMSGVSVTGNTLRNCGSTLHAAETAAYRTPIFIAPYSMLDVTISRNMIIDDFDVARIPYAIYVSSPSTGTPSGIHMIDNVVNVSGADKSAFTIPYYFDTGCNIYASGCVPNGYVPTVYGQLTGSEWLDASLNRRYKIVAVDGALIIETRGSAAPTTGVWTTGSVVWNSVPASGQPLGWVCTSGGTSGTWKAMANLA